MAQKNYWLKERYNPQLQKAYYVKCGKLSKTAALKKENSLHGFNIMREYSTEAEYLREIKRLESDGFTVYEN